VALTGLLCWGLGGSRGAQALAMSGYLLCPASLGASSFLSMISFEPVFWMTAVFALEMLVRTGGRDRRAPAWWLLFGLSAGLGMLNKISIVAFLLALLAALLLTPQRRLLGSRWCLAAVALAAAIELPNFCWQAGHGFPFREFLRNGHHAKMDAMPPLAFLLQQVVIEHPLAVLLWGAGVLWLLFSPSARSWRWMGLAYVFFLAGMLLVHAKDYYLSAVYPMVFAAGGAAWQAYAERSGRRWITPAWAALLLATGLLLLPMSLPVLRPPAWVAYAAPLRRYIHETEKHYDDGPLPGQFADRLGWQQMADQVAAVYDSLPPAERAQAGILCQNYGEAGAINVLRRRRDLPLAISPHNNFYLWGTQ
jgi:4-amino-4-deoxy-L-arabinose transferase-like glycosyltransferase